jgi:hypothetical protein
MAPSSNQPTDTASPAAEHCTSSTVGPVATVIDITISDTTSRSRVPHTSHFRFPNTLQNLGSGTGKPIKFRDQKPIRKRDPAQDFSRIAVRNAQGVRVDKGDPHLVGDHRNELAVNVPKLPPGEYAVTWHATSVDTHKTEGRFEFAVAR